MQHDGSLMIADSLTTTALKLRLAWGWIHLLVGALLMSGCATPIGVQFVDPREGYQSLTANILSAGRPSSFSARELMNLNLYQRFQDEPEKALAEMHASLAPEGDEDRLFALTELSFAHAGQSGNKSYYLAAAVYAYSFLLPGKHGAPPRMIDPRLRWATDIYNEALTRAAMVDRKPVPRGGVLKLPFGELTVDFNENDLIWAGYRLTDFVPAADIEVRGLRNRYRIPGIGEIDRQVGILHAGLGTNRKCRRDRCSHRIRNHFCSCADSGGRADLGL